MRAPIHSQKHYVQVTLSTATTGTTNTEVFIQAVESTVANTVSEVVEGALVKAVFIELWVIGGTADQFFTIIIEKRPSARAAATHAQMASLGTFPNKKNILYTSQGLAPNDGVGQPVPVIRQWFKIPRGKQRMGLGDLLSLNISSRGDGTLTYCGFATYKEYT